MIGRVTVPSSFCAVRAPDPVEGLLDVDCCRLLHRKRAAKVHLEEFRVCALEEGEREARFGLQIESLSVFLAAAEARSIAKAAQKLYITPQGASSSIIALEKQLGVKLFVRTGSSVELTAGGRAVANEAERVMSAYRRLQTTAAIQGDAYHSDDAFDVVVSPYVAQTLMPHYRGIRGADAWGATRNGDRARSV